MVKGKFIAIEDYKVDNNDIMCWDRDWRHNINISPHRLKLNQVSEISSEIPEFTLIKGLLKSTQEFRQYTKLGDSLYEMSAEVANERTALKNNSSPIIRQPKKYLRAEGFEWDRNYGCYSAPTNYLPDNFVEKHFQIETCLVQIDPSNNHIKMILQDPWLYLHGLDRFEDLDLPRDLNIIIDAWDERGAMSGDNLYISYSFEYDNLEDFKKAWEQYKKDLPARLKKFNDTLKIT